jgi:hypothetical protein
VKEGKLVEADVRPRTPLSCVGAAPASAPLRSPNR